MGCDPERLASMPVFAGLSTTELERVSRWAEIRHADPGETLVGEGASGYSFFLLEKGSASVSSAGEDVSTLGEGDFFGEIAILGEGRRTATVTATSPVTYLTMFGSDFRQLEAEFPAAAERIREAMAQRTDQQPT
jgi:CRP-like cAMP-binding protein